MSNVAGLRISWPPVIKPQVPYTVSLKNARAKVKISAANTLLMRVTSQRKRHGNTKEPMHTAVAMAVNGTQLKKGYTL